MTELEAAKRTLADELALAKLNLADALGWTLEHLESVIAAGSDRLRIQPPETQP